jgi:hypothetical protein
VTSSAPSRKSSPPSLLQNECGLLRRLADEYLRFYPDYREAIPNAWEERSVRYPAPPAKDDIVPGLRLERQRLSIATRKGTLLVWFDPVLGTYHVTIKGDGHQIMAAVLPLCGVDDAAWGELRGLLDAGIADWRKLYPYRRLPGIQYRPVDKNTRAGPKVPDPEPVPGWGAMPKAEFFQ